MDAGSIVANVKSRMQKAIHHLREDLKKVRAGRANVAMVENIVVEVYGSQMHVRDLAALSTPELRQILITPFDGSNLGPIKQGIEKANLNFTPIIDSSSLRIVIPSPTEEDRKKYVSIIKDKGEEAKVTVRHVRQEGNKAVRKQKSDGEISEDSVKGLEKKIQEITNQYCKEIDGITNDKIQEITIK